MILNRPRRLLGVIRWTTRCLILSISLLIVGTSANLAADQDALTIETAYGPVQGVTKGNVQEFLGIPYAAPPVGDLRWQPPRPPAPWSAPRSATIFGNICAQNDAQVVFATPSESEDCLYLNVFRKAGDDTTAGQHGKHPVMVWIYGGNLLDGESNDYDASALASQGAIVVTFNYRVGILGWLAHPALDGEGHEFANYGMLDQQFALKWIKQNISAFGGDPGNVTLFGQSAGARAVYANIISPAAGGLFQHAITQSGAMFKAMPLSVAAKKGTDFAIAAGCSDQSAACLRALPVQQLLKAQQPYLTGLVLDGSIMPLQPSAAFSSGQFNRVPLINGTVRDEATFFTAVREAVVGHPLGDDEYRKALFGILYGKVADGIDVDKVVTAYPPKAYPSPNLAYATAVTDLYACMARQQNKWISKYVPVYAYEFNDRTAPSYFPAASFPMGAYHTGELQFLFPLFKAATGIVHPLNSAEQKLSYQMVSSWVNFAKFGSLKSPWNRYDTRSDNYLSLDIGHLSSLSRKTFSNEHNCTFWDENLIQ